MPFGLTIGTDRAIALQQSIQDELITRGYSPDADPVMAEYITIMIINNKTAAQITSELEDLIGSDYDHSFTDWLFKEAAKGSNEVPEVSPLEPIAPEPIAPERPVSQAPRDPPPHLTNEARRPPNAPRNGVYQQALSQALPSAAPSAHKRTASARSPSPNHPNKVRRTDVPTGPRAMQREGPSTSHSRSLLDRVGGPAGSAQNGTTQHDDIQARIDNITNGSPDPGMMMAGGYPGMNGMDMNAMAATGMGNPMMLQEIMMNQMALMAQITGMMNPAQFGGFPMQGAMPGDVAMMQQNMGMNGFQGQGHSNGAARGRGGGRGGRGIGRGRGGTPSPSVQRTEEAPAEPSPSPTAQITNPTPIPATTPVAADAAAFAAPVVSATPSRPGYAVLERPQSPTLCKYGLKCTNAHCRWSHPSPVATQESGMVLSNDHCENGKDCKDKDCIKAHVSPAVLKPQDHHAPSAPPHSFSPSNPIPCRFGTACTRPNCAFSHPPRPQSAQCRFGAGCTRATCPYQHPEGRVLPTSFHRGLSTSAPLVNVQTPETGSMGGPSPHKSVTFNNAGMKEKIQKQMKAIEEKKNQAEKAVKEAEAAAAASSKKDDTNSVAITA